MPKARRPVTDPTLAVAYLRTSTDDQANGLQAQRDACQRHAARTGLRIVAWHQDVGVSGGKAAADRPGFIDATARMQTAAAGVFLIAKRDRLARDVIEAAIATRMIERQGARIESADGVPHAKTPEGQLMRTLLDAFAEYERSMIRARTAAALRARRERGLRFTLHPPYGWRLVGGRMVADPAQQKTLVRMRTLRSRGETYRAIGARLLAEGRRPARAKAWSIGMVRSLVHRSQADAGTVRRGA